MEDGAVEEQIARMVQFIKQEAEEKAREIASAADEEFNIEKLQHVEAEKQKIRKDFERKESQIEITKKIEHSTQLNQQRLKLLKARDSCLLDIYDTAKASLNSLSHTPAYKGLLAKLIVQACKRLEGEKAVTVRCRECDIAVTKEAIELAKASVQSAMTLDTKTFLPPPPGSGGTASCCGGVVLLNGDGRISCSNTLDDRLRISFEQTTPKIRAKIVAAGL